MPKSKNPKMINTILANPRHISLIISILLCGLILGGLPHLDARAESQPLTSSVESNVDLPAFEAYLDEVRQALKIPGMSAAVVQNQELLWAAGFGYADMENQVAAVPDTPYGLASVTKPVAAVLIMQLVEEGLIDLDAPVKQYGVSLGDEAITVRHLLTHTSEGIPGTTHHYNGDRYGFLGGVIEGATGQTFATLLSEKILLPLKMENTALNPINRWGGGGARNILEDLKIGLAWGENFQHYPDVYERYARPYQLDEAFNIIPGMYQLYHNPAAGLISSVTDLAKFDIALDQGRLLGDSAKVEMFSPAYSTLENHPDLNYGLGWYVQDFEGLRLLWHCGRWPPSTSALYLKVPEKNITFIVLANTDNLTVPFSSIGDGDVTKSILALSFFRHFIFPDQQGYDLPTIDWNADQAVLLKQLADVDDEATREFLERELWSFRQVYASTGQFEQVEKLRRVSFRAYPNSIFRRDQMFTNITGPTTVIPPTPPASVFVWLNRGAVMWLVLVCISVIWIAARLLRAQEFSWWGKFLWLTASLFLGPISLILLYRCSQSTSDKGQPTTWQRAWGASALSTAVHSVAWSIAIALLINTGSEPHPLLTLGLTYLIPLLMGLLFIRIPFIFQQVKARSWSIITRLLLVEVTSLNLRYAVFFLLTMLLSDRLFSQIPYPTNPLFWFMISFIAIVSVIILTPLQYWMLKRDVSIPVGLAMDASMGDSIPDLRATWPALLTTFTIMAIAMVITIGQLG